MLLIAQLKEIYIDAELDVVDTTQWYPEIMRKDFTVGLQVTEAGVDDPDQAFYESYVCGVGAQLHRLLQPGGRQAGRPAIDGSRSGEAHKLVWEIERRLAEDAVRPVIFYPRGGTCRQPWVKGLTIMVNSIYNGWRFEDVWLDK